MIRASRDLTGAELAALRSACADALSVFTDAGFTPVEPGQLLAAEDLLDLYGEDVRGRAFVFEGDAGEELCLRPDLTLAICRHHLVEAGGGAGRYAASGPVFRRAADGERRPAQFEQVGCEWFGAADEATAEAACLRLTQEALARIGCRETELLTGDLGLLFSLLDAVEMPQRWRARLKRHVWRPTRFRGLLAQLAEAQDSDAGRLAFLKALGGLEAEQARAAVERMLSMSETTHVGLRGFDEIAVRFLEQAEDARAHPLSAPVVAAIEAASRLKAPASEVPERMARIARSAGLEIDTALERFEQRVAALAQSGVDPAALPFDAEFGRNLEYYDGFVFEICDPRISRADGRRAAQLAGGGRYARLLPAAARAFAVEGPVADGAFGAALRPETALRAAGGAS